MPLAEDEFESREFRNESTKKCAQTKSAVEFFTTQAIDWAVEPSNGCRVRVRLDRAEFSGYDFR